MNLKKKNYIVLGGSYEQYEYINYLKKNYKHLNIICCDINAKAYCKYISDQFFQIDIKNKKNILNLARKLKVVGISSHISEHGIGTIKYVSNKLNLPSSSEISVKATQSKFYCKKILNEKNNYIKLEKFKINKIKKINNNSPIVLKPDVGSGQRNLFKITKNSKSEIIKKKFFLSKNSSKNKFVAIEKFIKGEEINVVCLIINKKIYKFTYSLRKRYTKKEGFGVVYRHEYKSYDYLNLNNKIKNYINKIILKFKLSNAIIYPQFILDESNKLNLIEYGERIPGGKMRELFEYATGINLLDAQFQISIKFKNLKIKRKKKNYKFISIDFINGSPGPLKSGRVKLIKKFKLPKNNKIIEDNYFLPVKPNQNRIKIIKSSSDRFYYFICASNSEYNFKENIKFLIDHLNIMDYKNNSLKKKNFYRYIL